MMKQSDSGIALRLTALAIALVFCIGMFAPMTAGSVPAAQPVPAAAPVPDEPDTIELQPNASVGKDTWIRSLIVNDNFGVNTLMPIGSAGGESFVGLIQFELPSNNVATLQQATLSMYNQRASAGTNVSVHGVSVIWEEGEGDFSTDASNWTYNTDTTTWTTPGGDYYPLNSSMEVSVLDTWYSWDVTNIVGSWMNGLWDNNGFLLRTDTNDWVQFYSSDYSMEQYWPKLTITYAAEITDPVPAQVFQEDDPARDIALNGRANGSIEHVSNIANTSLQHPFWGSMANMYHLMTLYNANEIGGEGQIRKLSFNRTALTDTGIFNNVKIMMTHTTATALDPTTFAINNVTTGAAIEVFNEASIFLNSSSLDSWIHFDLNDNFTYDSQYNLIVWIEWSGDGGDDVSLDATITGPVKFLQYNDNTAALLGWSRQLVTKFTTDVVDNAVVDEGTTSNAYPFCPGVEPQMRMQMLYNKTFINQSGIVDKICYQSATAGPATGTFNDLSIRMAHSTNGSLDTVFEAHRTGAWVEVFNKATYDISTTGTPEWIEFDLQNTFNYNGIDNLLVDIRWTGASGNFIWLQTRSLGYDCRAGAGDSSATTADYTDGTFYNIQVLFTDSVSLTWSATSSDPTLFAAGVVNNELRITPQPDAFGTGTVSLRLTNTENGGYATQLIPVTISAINDAPILAALPDIICVEDIPRIIDIAASMSDIEDDIYNLVVIEDSAYANVSGTNITFLYPEGVAFETVSVTISDPGGLSDMKTFLVNVTQINDEPYFTGFPANVTCDATMLKTLNLVSADEESASNDLTFFTASPYANITGHTLQLLYPKGIGTDQITVFLVDELTYGTQNNVSYLLNVTIIDHPDVVAHTPTGTAVPVITTIQATFDMPMNTTKVESAFSLKLGTTAINGTYSWNANGTVMTFT
ncbi:MAG: DNRLRE domain-containing protein, partial [Candidatus Thermoplasmatota archaeon]|nr:DNRLRE domain-containing protein [Candidatus Thermoplasmatota archaeon]